MKQEAETTLTRKELYDQVWSKPMTTLAKQFGISDSSLRKICVKMNIPMPKGGYWAKVQYAKKVKKLPMSIDDTVLKEITISQTSEVIKNSYKLRSQQEQLKIKIAEEIGKQLTVPEKLTRADPIIQNTKDLLIGKIDYSDVRRNNLAVLHTKMSKEMEPRALRIMDTLLKAIRHWGYKIECKSKECCLSIDGIELGLSCREKEARIINEGSKETWDKFKLQFTGKLCIQIRRSYHRIDFIDGKSSIEEQLATILAQIQIATDTEKQWNAEITSRRAIEKIEHEKQEEKNAIEEKEMIRLNQLLEESERFQLANSLRHYIEAIRCKTSESAGNSPQVGDWLSWAEEKADWLDPTINRKVDLLEGLKFNSLLRIQSKKPSLHSY